MKFPTILLTSLVGLALSSAAVLKRTVETVSADPVAFSIDDHGRLIQVYPGKIAALSLPTEEEKRAILLIHNQYRAKHHAPALVWNDTAADFGNEWISKCNFEHSGGGPNKFGENLAWGTGAFDYKDAVDFWYSEVKNYNYSQPGFSANTGHFTQVVWKSTTSVGCAKYACPRPNAPTTIVNMIICDYDPAGNITNEGYFAANVQAP